MGALDWSADALQNAIADPLIPAVDGASARALPSLVRGVQAGVAALAADQGGALTTAGDADAYTATTTSGIRRYRTGLRLVVKADRDSQTAPSFAPDGLAPKPWLDASGAAARVKAGRFYVLTYDPARGWVSDALPVLGNGDLAPVPGGTLKGRSAGATGVAQDLTPDAVKALLALAVPDVAGLQSSLDGKAAQTALVALQSTVNGKANSSDITTAVAPLSTAIASLAAGQQSGSFSYDTLAQLAANLAPPDGATGQVLSDGTNNGFYVKSGASGAGSWVKKNAATIPGLDASTAFVRQTLTSIDDGSFNIADPFGNIGLRFDGANGLQVALAQLTRLVAAQLQVPGALSISANPDDGALLVTDAGGMIVLRLDGSALSVFNLIASGVLSAGAYNFGDATLAPYADPNIAFAIADRNGWMGLALTNSGQLIVPSLQANVIPLGADYSSDYIAERNARAIALAAGYRGLTDTTSAATVWNYNHAIWYGQSLCAAQEGWPAKTLSGPSDVLMIGQSTRPGGANIATAPAPLGDAVLRPAIATVQVQGTGALIDAAGQAALAAGNDALGEEAGVAAMQFARRMFLQRLGVQAADDRRFVTTNVGVSGRSIEELSKGATTEFFNRLRTMATAVKNAATAAGGSYGVAALFWLQGEWNYSGTNGGATDKASYKANLLKLYNDFVADVCVGIAGQSEKPAIITYQTGGQFTVDTTDMSIGMAQWELSQENQSWYLAAPSYPVTDKGAHLDANGYRWLGCQLGKVFFETVIMRRRWKPLSPIQATWRGQTVLVDFHLPSGTPLQFQSVYVGQAATLYPDKGFTVIDASGTVPLTSVTLAGDAVVQITAQRALVAPVNVYYGRATTFSGGGNLCDSDPTQAPFKYDYTAGSGDYAAANIPALNGSPYPLWNWCIAFKITAAAN